MSHRTYPVIFPGWSTHDQETDATTTKHLHWKTTGAVHLHPLLKVEKESRQQFLRAWAAMGLNWCIELDGGFSPFGGGVE